MLGLLAEIRARKVPHHQDGTKTDPGWTPKDHPNYHILTYHNSVNGEQHKGLCDLKHQAAVWLIQTGRCVLEF